MPAAPFFAAVRVAPQPGDLKTVSARVPHPKGFIDVELAFDGGKARGTVALPQGVSGTFEFGGATLPLIGGINKIG